MRNESSEGEQEKGSKGLNMHQNSVAAAINGLI